MRLLGSLFYIWFNIYLIESANRTENEIVAPDLKSEKSEINKNVSADKSDNSENVLYEDYEYIDGGTRENGIFEKSEKRKGNLTESEEYSDRFPNEVFLSLRNITADAATAFRSFTNRNDVNDLQASASDNLNVTSNVTFGDTSETAGINLRALRDAGYPPEIIEDSPGGVYLPYKHAKIDTADLSDCALQGEWKPMGVAHGQLHQQIAVAGDQQAEILQSVGSYSIPNKVIPHWNQNYVSQVNQDFQNYKFPPNHKPAANGVKGFASSSSFNRNNLPSHSNSGLYSSVNPFNHQYGSGVSVYAGGFSGQFQKSKSNSMLSPPPLPPIIFGKKPGHWKSFKPKHKLHHDNRKRPVGISGAGNFGYPSKVKGNSDFTLGHFSQSFKGGPGNIHFGYGSGGAPIKGLSLQSNHGSSTATFAGSLEQNSEGTLDANSLLGYVNQKYKTGHFTSGTSAVSGSVKHEAGGLPILGPAASHSSAASETAHSTSGNSGYLGNGNDQIISAPPVLPLGYESGEGLTLGPIGHESKGKHLISGSSSLSNSPGQGSGATVTVSSTSGLVNHGNVNVNAYNFNNGGEIASGSFISGSSHLNEGFPIATGGELLHSTPSSDLLTHGTRGDHSIENLISSSSLSGGEYSHPEASFHLSHGSGGGASFPDSTFSSSHISQGIGNSLPGASFLSSHGNHDFAVHGQKVSDDLSSSSTFTCGKNHDHNTNYHTATFQVADHDHPSSVDVLRYQGDAAVLIQADKTSFHDQIPERKHYAWSDKGDTEASGTDTRNELSGEPAQLISNPAEQEIAQSETEAERIPEDGEEPERHSYYHEITKVTKIPATSVGSVQYTYSQYETKPQSFTQGTETNEEEPVEQPQIIRELEQLSNKFQLDLENPQKLFEDPPSQDLSYHYPFHGVEAHEEVGNQNFDSLEGDFRVKIKEDGHNVITEFPQYIEQNGFTSKPEFPITYNKKPQIKYIPRPGKPQFYQKTQVNYLQPRPPIVILRKHKPKQYIKKKQNYEVHEHSGERHRPIGEIFPPQKYPKQFHNPKPNFAVDRPKNGWRPSGSDYLNYSYDFSHGKKVKKYKTQKQKVLAPVLIKRPVSEKIPVIRVVEVSG